MDALRVRLLAVEAHNAVSYDDLESFYADEAQHHRKQIEVSMFEGNRHQRIAHTMNLMEEMFYIHVTFQVL